MLAILFIVAILAGLLQGLTGFGSGIVLMLVLPHYFPILESSAIAGVIGLFLCGGMIIKFRHIIKVRELFLPVVLYMTASSLALLIGKNVNSAILQKIFGLFLLTLAVYYLVFDKNKKTHLRKLTKIIFVFLSGISDGLFGIGGPLMVVYFLNQTDTQKEYLAQIQTFFFINAFYLTLLRISQNLLSLSNLSSVIFGGIGIVLGSQLGVYLVPKINKDIVRKGIYVVIGISGMINLL